MNRVVRKDTFGLFFTHDGEKLRPEGSSQFEEGDAVATRVAVSHSNAMRAMVVSVRDTRQSETWTNVGTLSRVETTAAKYAGLTRAEAAHRARTSLGVDHPDDCVCKQSNQ